MSGVQNGRLGGHPAASAFCAPCRKGIAIAAWPDEDDPAAPMMIRTAQYETENLDERHRLDIVSDALVTVPGLRALGEAFAYVLLQSTQFLNAWMELHSDCQPDNDGVDQT